MPNQTACAQVTLSVTASRLLLHKQLQCLLEESPQSEEPTIHDDERTVFLAAISLQME